MSLSHVFIGQWFHVIEVLNYNRFFMPRIQFRNGTSLYHATVHRLRHNEMNNNRHFRARSIKKQERLESNRVIFVWVRLKFDIYYLDFIAYYSIMFKSLFLSLCKEQYLYLIIDFVKAYKYVSNIKTEKQYS